ncbi:MAG: hypothetical protein K0V04_03255, partial [Deltaproteobacteria bacterium]|nr:hypothetical protein [Deltaproteobacteria bacterium]
MTTGRAIGPDFADARETAPGLAPAALHQRLRGELRRRRRSAPRRRGAMGWRPSAVLVLALGCRTGGEPTTAVGPAPVAAVVAEPRPTA